MQVKWRTLEHIPGYGGAEPRSRVCHIVSDSLVEYDLLVQRRPDRSWLLAVERGHNFRSPSFFHDAQALYAAFPTIKKAMTLKHKETA